MLMVGEMYTTRFSERYRPLFCFRIILCAPADNQPVGKTHKTDRGGLSSTGELATVQVNESGFACFNDNRHRHGSKGGSSG